MVQCNKNIRENFGEFITLAVILEAHKVMQNVNSHAHLANIRETMQIREGPSS